MDAARRARVVPGDRFVRDMREDSYDLVVSALPARVRDELGWVAGSA